MTSYVSNRYPTFGGKVDLLFSAISCTNCRIFIRILFRYKFRFKDSQPGSSSFLNYRENGSVYTKCNHGHNIRHFRKVFDLFSSYTQNRIWSSTRYSQLEGIGIGISGLVWYKITCPHIWIEAEMISSHQSSATDKMIHQAASLKKLAQPFRCSNIARQVFREVKILKYLQHENVCHLGVIANSETNQWPDHSLEWYFHLPMRGNVYPYALMVWYDYLTINQVTLWPTLWRQISTTF